MTSFTRLMAVFTLMFMLWAAPGLAKITEIKTECGLFECTSIFSIDQDIKSMAGYDYRISSVSKVGDIRSFDYGEFKIHSGSIDGLEIKVLKDGLLQVTGEITGASHNLWGFSFLGDKSHLESTWWNSSYTKCYNITINQTTMLGQVIELNLTNLTGTVSNVAIVNTYCYNNGTEIPFYNMSETATSLYGQFRVDETGSNIVYSAYYDNAIPVTPNRNYNWMYDHFLKFDTNRWGTVALGTATISGTYGIAQINTTSYSATCADMAGIYYKEPLTNFLSYPFVITGRWTRKTDQSKLGLVQFTGGKISLFATISPGNTNFAFHYIDSTCGAGTGGSGGTYPTYFLMKLNNTDATHTYYYVYDDAGTQLATYTHQHDDASTATFGGGAGDALASNSFMIDWVCANCNATFVIPSVTLGEVEYRPASPEYNITFNTPTPTNGSTIGFDTVPKINVSVGNNTVITDITLQVNTSKGTSNYSDLGGSWDVKMPGAEQVSYQAVVTTAYGTNTTGWQDLNVAGMTEEQLGETVTVTTVSTILLLGLVGIMAFALFFK